jgi:Heparinase II/III N-terminus
MLPGRNLKSYLLRIRRASVCEVAYRVRQSILIAQMRRAFANKHLIDVPRIDAREIERLQLPDFSFYIDDSVLQKLFAGDVFTIGGDREAIDHFEKETRGKYFGDIRCGSSSPDIRTVWEPARLQHVTAMLLCPASKGARDAAQRAVFQWVRNNPFLSGPHYMSAMECGLRIPVFFYALKILRDLAAEQRLEILETLYRHAWLVANRLSLYSSLGNHTICECIGLIFAGSIFRSVSAGRNWINRGLKLMSDELSHQVLNDGGPAEQSLIYHRFVLDLYWLAVGFLKKNGIYECKNFIPRLILGEQFLEAFRDDRGQLPAIGDSDDGVAVAPGIQPLMYYET